MELKKLITDLEAENPPEARLKLCLEFMRGALGVQPPNFRDFWDAQKRCLPLFKENLAAADRAALWNEYVELSKDVRRLRTLVDEQSSFAQEQIQLALSAIDADLNAFDERLVQMPVLEMPLNSQILAGNLETFKNLQGKLTLYGQLATRVQSMRKEVLSSPMRARTKNQLLEQLSKLGDRIFPPRKEIMQELGELYKAQVDQFIAEHFQDKRFKLPFYLLKDEIRAFQSLAKQLTLSTAVFQETRQKLSQCWDTVRIKDEERKKSQAEKPREERPKREPKKKEYQVEEKPKEAPRLSAKVTALIERSERGEGEDAAFEEEARQMLENGDEESLAAHFEKLSRRRKEIKHALEEYRKASGGSDLNIQESMGYQELMERDRDRLDRIEDLMQEIQDRLYA